jgi:hypothetical protein
MKQANIEQAYQIAKEQYAALGVDTEAAMKKLQTVPVSLHCWQGDDVGGFETAGGAELTGGIQATGNYPGKARTLSELRGDIEKALSLIPGTAPPEPARLLPRQRRHLRRPRPNQTRTFPKLDRLGQGQTARDGF